MILAGGAPEWPSPDVTPKQLPGIGLLFFWKTEFWPDAAAEAGWSERSPCGAKVSRRWYSANGIVGSGQ
jgi:hypothetical protein